MGDLCKVSAFSLIDFNPYSCKWNFGPPAAPLIRVSATWFHISMVTNLDKRNAKKNYSYLLGSDLICKIPNDLYDGRMQISITIFRPLFIQLQSNLIPLQWYPFWAHLTIDHISIHVNKYVHPTYSLPCFRIHLKSLRTDFSPFEYKIPTIFGQKYPLHPLIHIRIFYIIRLSYIHIWSFHIFGNITGKYEEGAELLVIFSEIWEKIFHDFWGVLSDFRTDQRYIVFFPSQEYK